MLHVIVLTVALSQHPYALEGVALDWAGLGWAVLFWLTLAWLDLTTYPAWQSSATALQCCPCKLQQC